MGMERLLFIGISCATLLVSAATGKAHSFTPEAVVPCNLAFVPGKSPSSGYDEFVISPEDINIVELSALGQGARGPILQGAGIIITLNRKRSIEWDIFRQDHVGAKTGVAVRLLGATILEEKYSNDINELYVHCPWKFRIGFKNLDEAYQLMKQLAATAK